MLNQPRASGGKSAVASERLAVAGTTLKAESETSFSALPRIRDLDAAQESTRLAKHIMLAQGGAAMAAHANHSPQSVLRLLQN